MFAALRTLLTQWFQPPPPAAETDPTSPEHHPVPYDENMLERARTQWQFGEWTSLAQLNRDILQHHPDRAKLALLAAAGRLQTAQNVEAKQYICLAQDWGVSEKLIGQILISGVYNSIGRASVIIDKQQKALRNFQCSIDVGALGGDVNLLAQARMQEHIMLGSIKSDYAKIEAEKGDRRSLTTLSRCPATVEPKPRYWLHEYWRSSQQDPMNYVNSNVNRSLRLVEIIQKFVRPGRILEIGSNAGRNLHHLHKSGYRELEGIEISPVAVATLRKIYPELSEITIHVGPVEDIIESFADKSFECVFTMAVLEHIHVDSEWIFAHIARIAHCVITVEDELRTGERHFPRNYERVFTSHGMRQIHMEDRQKWGLPSGFAARVFVSSTFVKPKSLPECVTR